MRRVSLVLVAGWMLTVLPSAQTKLWGEGQAAASAPAASAAERSKQLAALLDEIWQDTLKHSPELASTIGDKRYDDQLTDYSVSAVNAALARGLGYIERLGAIDTTGLTDQEKLSSTLMLRSLIEDQEAAKFKEWQMPVNQFYGFHVDFPRLVTDLSFDGVKDYDNYIARLKKVPTAFSQIRTNMELGMEAGRMPPAYLMEKVTAQAQAIADQKPADSPFALPLKSFPKTVSAAEQKRITTDMLAAITDDVLPAYKRFATYMRVQYAPAGRKEPGSGRCRMGTPTTRSGLGRAQR